MKNDFEGFVLVGGKSSRMGADKAFLKIGDETFLERAVKNLQSLCDDIKIVLNKNQTRFLEYLPPPIPYIFDTFENRGACAGIHAALKNSKSKFTFILAVDMPFVSSLVITNLAQIADNSQHYSAVVPIQNDNRIQPLCAVYRTEKCLPEIEKLLIKDKSFSVRNFLDCLNVKFVNTPKIDGSKLFSNINTPQDYESLIKAKS